jgi:hypothetical protein
MDALKKKTRFKWFLDDHPGFFILKIRMISLSEFARAR